MIIKTYIEKHDGVKDKDYINKPVLDHFSAIINIRKGEITGHDESKTIGVITDAKTVGDKTELTIALWTQAGQLQGEWLLCGNGEQKPMAFSMGLERQLC